MSLGQGIVVFQGDAVHRWFCLSRYVVAGLCGLALSACGPDALSAASGSASTAAAAAKQASEQKAQIQDQIQQIQQAEQNRLRESLEQADRDAR